MNPSFLAGLNEPQLEAVTLPHQSALILAGAGSGKTRVLTTRIAWLIQSGQVSPAGLLAVTFTNKAAKEMLIRISAMLPINTRGMWVGTFHGLCNRMLRAHYRDAGLPQQFQILDSQDQLALIKRVMKAANVDDEKFPPRQVAWYVNSHKDGGKRAPDAEDYDAFSHRMKELYAIYDEQCQREGVVDFAELLLRCYELLCRNEILRDHYRGRFRHILVDEFQDTNRLQYQWLRLLAAGNAGASAPNAIFAVGDDDQSIYAFRGASAANMQDLQKDFAIGTVIKLEQNYRSHGHILDAANALIEHNRRRLGKNLWTSEGKGEPLRVYEAATDLDEAGFIVDEVQALHREGVRLGEIALLYRSNAQSRVLEHALFNAGMSYRVYGGLRFFERQEIKHALAYLRLLASDEDDGALLRVINFPARGIGNRGLEQLQDAARAQGISLWQAAVGRTSDAGRETRDGNSRDEDSAGMFEPVSRLSPGATSGTLMSPGVSPGSRILPGVSPGSRILPGVAPGSRLPPRVSPQKGVPAFVALIESMRAATANLALPEIVEHVIAHSGLKQHYQSERDGTDRLENLDELINAAAGFVSDDHEDDALAPAGGDLGSAESVAALSNRSNTLASFLAHAALEAGDNQAQAGADALQLMTVHSAKGLEFHSVFISGLEEGLFPHENSLSEADGKEEERRLMYVALTRARRRLYLSFAQSRMLHGQTRYNIASSFFHEIPEPLLKRINRGGAYAMREPDPPAARRGYGRGKVEVFAERGLPDTASPWRIGQNVVHPKFGAGVIVNAEGRGADARVQVNFGRDGAKWLALEYAKLTPA